MFMIGQTSKTKYCNQINPKLAYILDPIFIKKDRFAKTEKTTRALNKFLENANTIKAIIAEITASAMVICISNTGFEKNIPFCFHNPRKLFYPARGGQTR